MTILSAPGDDNFKHRHPDNLLKSLINTVRKLLYFVQITDWVTIMGDDKVKKDF